MPRSCAEGRCQRSKATRRCSPPCSRTSPPTPSSSAATRRPTSRSRPPGTTASGRSGWKTTASGSTRPTPTGCSSSSSGSPPRSAIPGRGSVWRCARRSSSSTAAASGSTPTSPGERRCAGPSPSPAKNPKKSPKKRNKESPLIDDPLAESAAPVEILLVEDDPGDVLMTKEALADAKMANELHVVSNGEEALEFLFQEGQYAEAPRPGLILLDLNLPRVDGREVLAKIKADELLRRIPVVVLTTSEAEEDILRSYDLHANAYVTKPVDFEAFVKVVRQVDEFYINVVRLPPR